jgi:hypothetical protein
MMSNRATAKRPTGNMDVSRRVSPKGSLTATAATSRVGLAASSVMTEISNVRGPSSTGRGPNTQTRTNPTSQRDFSLATGTPQPMVDLPRYVNMESTPVASVTGEQGHESKLWFETCQRSGRMDNDEALVKDISQYVRNELFPKLKFIMSKKQLNYASNGTTLCSLICKDFGMLDDTTAVAWWERFKGMMADVLNAKRADVTGALKRVFVRKSFQ